MDKKIIQQRRIAEKNKLLTQIKSTNAAICSSQSTLQHLNSVYGRDDNELSSNQLYYQTQVSKVHKDLDRNTDLLRTLSERLDSISSGKLDQELEEQARKAKEDADRKGERRKAIKKASTGAMEPKEKQALTAEQPSSSSLARTVSAPPQTNYPPAALPRANTERQPSSYYNNRRANMTRAEQIKEDEERSIRDYEFYLKLCDTVPGWMNDKLKKMPNNKGFVWRGLLCLGQLDPEIDNRGVKRPIQIFETDPKTKIQIITEVTSEHVRKYEKTHPKSEKVLVSERKTIR